MLLDWLLVENKHNPLLDYLDQANKIDANNFDLVVRKAKYQREMKQYDLAVSTLENINVKRVIKFKHGAKLKSRDIDLMIDGLTPATTLAWNTINRPNSAINTFF